MARPLRLEFPGALYHVSARGNAQEAIFRDDQDRRLLLDLLGKEVQQQDWICYAYVLMSNHYHLLFETPEPNLVQGMRRLQGVYTQAFNRRHTRIGHLFQGRYQAIVVDRDGYLTELARYLALNPVRARMARRASGYPWSSYRSTAAESPAPPWLATDRLLEHFGNSRARALTAYREFVEAGKGQPSPWDHLKGQIWLGDQDFLERMQKLAAGKRVRGIAKTQLQPQRPTAAEVLGKVSQHYRLTQQELGERRTPQAFRAAVYLLRRVANLPLAEVSKWAGVTPGRVSQIQRELEAQSMEDAKLARLLENYGLKP